MMDKFYLNDLFPAGASYQWATATALISGGLLAFALFLEHVQGLAPCPLCMMQRLWMILTALLAWISLAHNPRWGIYPLLGSLAAIVGAGFSIRQLWLQSLPVEEHPACGPGLEYMIEAFPLSDILTAMISGTGDCAQVSWTFLGLSIPGWVLLGFILLLATNALQFMNAGTQRRS